MIDHIKLAEIQDKIKEENKVIDKIKELYKTASTIKKCNWKNCCHAAMTEEPEDLEPVFRNLGGYTYSKNKEPVEVVKFYKEGMFGIFVRWKD